MIRIRPRRGKAPFALWIAPVAALGLAAALSACDAGGKSAWRKEPGAGADRREQFEAGYVRPPRVTSARRDGGLILVGEAAPDASVRLGSPTGQTVTTGADAGGRWRAAVPAADQVRLFGLSMTKAGRTVQAEGYVMVTPEGEVALLRAGAGAYRLAPSSAAPRILAIDYDQGGGAVISGVATPGAGLGVRIDRAPRAEGKADDEGRFAFSLTQPLTGGDHAIQVAGEGGEQLITVETTPPPALTSGPVLSRRTASGWRVDWMTPGGGVQTTQIIDPVAP
ncbi:MAG: hypothetical protein JWP92_1793 [Caulobacter sp.]|nr:hypothetical protein [Caulobacter sp.]